MVAERAIAGAVPAMRENAAMMQPGNTCRAASATTGDLREFSRQSWSMSPLKLWKRSRIRAARSARLGECRAAGDRLHMSALRQITGAFSTASRVVIPAIIDPVIATSAGVPRGNSRLYRWTHLR